MSVTKANDLCNTDTSPSLPPGAPLAFLSRLKLPFPSLSNACHAGPEFPALQANSSPTTGGFQNNLFSGLTYFSQANDSVMQTQGYDPLRFPACTAS